MDRNELLALVTQTALPAHKETVSDKAKMKKAHALAQVFHNMGDMVIPFGKPQIGEKVKKLPPRRDVETTTEPTPLTDEERATKREALRIELAQRNQERQNYQDSVILRDSLQEQSHINAHEKLIAARKQRKSEKAVGFNHKEPVKPEVVSVVINPRTFKGIFPGHPLYEAYLGYVVKHNLKSSKGTAKRFLTDKEFLKSIHVEITGD